MHTVNRERNGCADGCTALSSSTFRTSAATTKRAILSWQAPSARNRSRADVSCWAIHRSILIRCTSTPCSVAREIHARPYESLYRLEEAVSSVYSTVIQLSSMHMPFHTGRMKAATCLPVPALVNSLRRLAGGDGLAAARFDKFCPFAVYGSRANMARCEQPSFTRRPRQTIGTIDATTNRCITGILH